MSTVTVKTAELDDWAVDLMLLNTELDELEVIGSTANRRVETLIEEGIIAKDERHDSAADWLFAIMSRIVDRTQAERVFILESVSTGMFLLVCEIDGALGGAAKLPEEFS